MTAKASMGKTLCVILHYGSEMDTNHCVESMLQETHLDIVISDNDPSQTYEPPNHLKDHVKIIRTGGLAGFSEGNNIGVSAFLCQDHDAVLLLNNDTIVSEDAIKQMRQTLLQPRVGAVGPCLPYASNPEIIWACGGYIQRKRLNIGGYQPKSPQPYEVDYLPGTAIMCHSDIWKKTGGLSEKYFLAYEEAEFALEISRLGYKILVDPRATILHKVGMSGQQKPEYFYNNVRNRIIFSKYLFGKNYGHFRAILVTLITIRSRTVQGFIEKIRLWHQAVVDDLTGRPLNRLTLEQISQKFSSSTSMPN